jgi:hypothetical protein
LTGLISVFNPVESLTDLSSLEQVKTVIADLQTAEKCLAYLNRLTQLFFTMGIQEPHRLSLPERKGKHTVRIALGSFFDCGILEKNSRPRYPESFFLEHVEVSSIFVVLFVNKKKCIVSYVL